MNTRNIKQSSKLGLLFQQNFITRLIKKLNTLICNFKVLFRAFRGVLYIFIPKIVLWLLKRKYELNLKIRKTKQKFLLNQWRIF